MSRYIVAAVLFVVAVAPTFSRDICIGDCSHSREPVRCPMNEKKTLCGKLCEPRCESTKPTTVTPAESLIYIGCPSVECTQETAGCRCEENFVRNEQGMCVASDDCPK